jgi:hypothetical protein
MKYRLVIEWDEDYQAEKSIWTSRDGGIWDEVERETLPGSLYYVLPCTDDPESYYKIHAHRIIREYEEDPTP